MRGKKLLLFRGHTNPLVVWEDLFNDPRSAGAVDATVVPGAFVGGVAVVRSVTDAESKLSISGGSGVVSGGKAAPAWGDPGLWYKLSTPAAIGVGQGQGFLVKITPTTIGSCTVGFSSGGSGLMSEPYWSFVPTTDILQINAVTVGDLTDDVEVELFHVIRSSTHGHLFFWKESGQWKLLHVNEQAVVGSNSVYPGIADYNQAHTVDRVAHIDLSSKYDGDFAEVTDTKTNPANGTAVSMNADFSARWTFTYETGKFVDLSCRQADATHRISIQATATHLVVYKDDGGLASLGLSAGVFANGIGYQLDAVFEGSSIKVYLDNVLKQDITNAWQQTTTGGAINNNLVTNDIVLTTHPYPSLGLSTSRTICPQLNATQAHTADARIEVRGVVLPSANSITIDMRISGTDEITLDMDSNGKPIVKENGVARITGSNADVSDAADVAVVLDGASVSLYVNGAQISTTFTTLGLTGGTGIKLTSIGTAGAMDAIEAWPLYFDWNLG